MSEGIKEPLTIAVEAKDLTVGDRVVGKGILSRVDDNGMIVVLFEDADSQVYHPSDSVQIVMEDHGETSEELAEQGET